MMDHLIHAKVQNIINEINNQLLKEEIDTAVARTLFQFAVSRMLLLTTHVGYLEEKIDILEKSNNYKSVVIENISAENQRLSQIAKY